MKQYVRLVSLLSAIAIFFVSTVPAVVAQSSDSSVAPLEIQNNRYTIDQLREMDRAIVAVEMDDETVEYEGVWLDSLLVDAGVSMGESLRGEQLNAYVQALARDGYKIIFSLAELDQGLSGNRVLVADLKSGKDLDSEEGPVRLVVSSDTRHGRWVRMLASVNVVKNP